MSLDKQNISFATFEDSISEVVHDDAFLEQVGSLRRLCEEISGTNLM